MCKLSIAIATAALSLAPLALAQQATTSRATSVSARRSDPDMQRAIQFQRLKDRDDARQARKERVHPSVNYTNADRRIETPNTVKDQGEVQVKKHKKIQ